MKTKLLVILILLIGLGLRLWKINIPLLEFSPSRQIQTAEITENIINDNFNFLYPRVNYYGRDDDKYLLVEFPVYNLIVASFDLISTNYELNGRLISVAFYVISFLALYKIAEEYTNKKAALISVYFFSISPLNVLTSRSFQPDEMLLAASLGSFYLLIKWVKQDRLFFYFFSLLLFAVSILIKVTVLVFLGLPLIFLLYSYKKGWRVYTIIYFTASLLPFLIWYLHSSQFSKALNIQSSATYNISTWFGFGTFLDFKYYSNIFGYEANLVLLPLGVMLFVLGFFLKRRRAPIVLYLWFLSLVLYFLIFNKHVMTHEYYHLPFLPLASIFIGLGASSIIESLNNKVYLRKTGLLIIFSIIIFVLYLPTIMSRTYAPIERFKDVVFVGSRIERLTKDDELVIGLMDEGPALVHYSNRLGWGFVVDPIKVQKHQKFIGVTKEAINPIGELEKLRKRGAVIFASSYKPQLLKNHEFSEYLYQNFSVLEESDNYVIFDLRHEFSR